MVPCLHFVYARLPVFLFSAVFTRACLNLFALTFRALEYIGLHGIHHWATWTDQACNDTVIVRWRHAASLHFSFSPFSSVNVDDVIYAVRQLHASRQPPVSCRRLLWSRSSNMWMARWPPATFRLVTRKHSSNRSSRKQAWIAWIACIAYQWCQFTSTDLELIGFIEAFSAHRCSPSDGRWLNVCRHPALVAV